MFRRLVRWANTVVQGHPQLKRLLKSAFRKVGLSGFMARYTGQAAVGAYRASIAARFLKGEGLEIGAMHFPLSVPAGVKVNYVDLLSRQEAIRFFPGLEARMIVEPDLIEDGFILQTIESESQDFLIANHVLEHSSNPLETLENWTRVVRPEGILFLTVPIGSKCFDRGRPETPIRHLLEDYYLVKSGQYLEFADHNLVHYREWVAISGRNAAREEGRKYGLSDPDFITRESDVLAAAKTEIHFHVFSFSSFRNFLEAAAREIPLPFQVEEILTNGMEVTGILRVTTNVAKIPEAADPRPFGFA